METGTTTTKKTRKWTRKASKKKSSWKTSKKKTRKYTKRAAAATSHTSPVAQTFRMTRGNASMEVVVTI